MLNVPANFIELQQVDASDGNVLVWHLGKLDRSLDLAKCYTYMLNCGIPPEII